MRPEISNFQILTSDKKDIKEAVETVKEIADVTGSVKLTFESSSSTVPSLVEIVKETERVDGILFDYKLHISYEVNTKFHTDLLVVYLIKKEGR